MSYLNIDNINKSFGAVTACKDIKLQADQGDIIVICGESGSGKSTFLNILAGFENSETGSIELDGKLIFDNNNFIKPQNRNISLLFQNYSLFPNMTILNNLKYAQKDNINIGNLLELLNIEELTSRYPHQISGGQMQRAALARTLAANPKLILMDEPFSSLDNTTKDEVRINFKNIIQELNKTAIIVSHDINDAYSLADNVLVMKSGEVLDSGKPEQIYTTPRNEYSARLFGDVNILDKNVISKLTDSIAEGSLFALRPENIIAEPNGVWKCASSIFKGNYYLSILASDNHSLKVQTKSKLLLNNFYNLNINNNSIIKLK